MVGWDPERRSDPTHMNFRDIVVNGMTAVTGVCAIIVTIHALRTPSATEAAAPWKPMPLAAAVWRPLLSAGHRIGPPGARLTAIEFGDFQCPVCGAYEHVLDSVRERYPKDFAVIFYEFPLPYHPLAYPLARAAECASNQGRFAAFHDSIYAEQGLLGVIPILDLAIRSGIPDTAAFRRCVTETVPVTAIENDLATGRRIGVPGTPAIIVNGVMHTTDLRVRDFEQMIQSR